MFSIREATPRDLPVIVSFNEAMAMETEGLELDHNTVATGVALVLGSPNKGFYLLAEIKGEPVGQLLITREWSDWRNGDFWWIQSVYVKPEYRRQGIYSHLHAEVLKMAKTEANVCGIRLYVDHENKLAQEAYLRLGMRKSDYIIMEADLGIRE